MADRLASLDYSILQQCMHCGMCLPSCPTYVETKKEKNSPRGRISLMRAIADGETPMDEAFGKEMYYCLGCLACQTACPAGVDYVKLFETARAEVEQEGVLRGGQRRFWRWLTLDVLFMRPRWLRAAGSLLALWQGSGLDRLFRRIGFLGLLPGRLKQLEPQTPRIRKPYSDARIAREENPPGEQRFRVGLLTGCVQDLAFSDINRDTVDVLLANGCSVVTPRLQHCCGSLHAHNGAVDRARDLARRQLDSFEVGQLDAIISNAGGCGSHLRHYSDLLQDDPEYAARAVQWDAKVRDIHEWLAEIGFRSPSRAGSGAGSVTYHESCHLSHGQKVVDPPRQILQAIPGLDVRELPESNWCCGSAGIYNITQPEQSEKLLQRKLRQVASTGAARVATSNPGCHLQLQKGGIEVVQPVSLLAGAYRAEVEGSVPIEA